MSVLEVKPIAGGTGYKRFVAMLNPSITSKFCGSVLRSRSTDDYIDTQEEKDCVRKINGLGPAKKEKYIKAIGGRNECFADACDKIDWPEN